MLPRPHSQAAYSQAAHSQAAHSHAAHSHAAHTRAASKPGARRASVERSAARRASPIPWLLFSLLAVASCGADVRAGEDDVAAGLDALGADGLADGLSGDGGAGLEDAPRAADLGPADEVADAASEDGPGADAESDAAGGDPDSGDAATADAATNDAAETASASEFAIVTASALTKAIEGKAYSAKIEAKGGTAPYFFGQKGGALPKGLGLGADGTLSGTPTESGSFAFDIKALDDAVPTATDKRSFTLEVGLAPLEIVGSQQINLLVTKLIVLPLIIVVDKVPVPYNAQLEAQGGKKPYQWVETPLPGAVKNFIPNAGLPKGLTLGKDGKVSGAVSDASLVVKVQVPLTQISLEGFFFAAEVSDSQATPQKKTAMFILPTVPVGGN